MTNHTPEIFGVVPTRIAPCGWCVSVHVANVDCRCTEPCESLWCPRTVEEDFRL